MGLIMDYPLLIASVALLLCSGVFLLRGRSTSQQTQIEQAQMARDVARCQAIEEGLRGWLKMLELPQLEEEKKLQAVAHQLRIVLVEKLMRGPRVR